MKDSSRVDGGELLIEKRKRLGLFNVVMMRLKDIIEFGIYSN